jgi:archaellum biogenesis ATPase FlaH
MSLYEEKVVNIFEIEGLLNNGYSVEVESPDGFVPVSSFVDKGDWPEYVLSTVSGKTVRCNSDHLFETPFGWKKSESMVGIPNTKVLTIDGWEDCFVVKTKNKIPIVDIQVEHKNHRYYTEGVSSHNTGVGKSLFMCHVAAGCMVQGKNVLYITMEMAEEKIAERIDANLLNTTLDDLMELPKDMYDKKVARVRSKCTGKLIIKEYPTASASTTHFRTLLNELNLKKSFIPDIIFIDYLNICCSSRIKAGANINSYTYVKSIAEELRGLAVEYNVPIVSATQTTRAGFCLDVNTNVKEKNKGNIKISEVNVGDELLSETGYNIVKNVFDMQNKKVYKITTESGKEIICSEQHMFPTTKGEKSLTSGLCVNDEFFINS